MNPNFIECCYRICAAKPYSLMTCASKSDEDPTKLFAHVSQLQRGFTQQLYEALYYSVQIKPKMVIFMSDEPIEQYRFQGADSCLLQSQTLQSTRNRIYALFR
jgi:hypothetical protein